MNDKHKLRNSRHTWGIEGMVRSITYLLLRLEDLSSVSSICIENPTAACAHSPCTGEQLISQPVSPNQQTPGSLRDCLKDREELRKDIQRWPLTSTHRHTCVHAHGHTAASTHKNELYKVTAVLADCCPAWLLLWVSSMSAVLFWWTEWLKTLVSMEIILLST